MIPKVLIGYHHRPQCAGLYYPPAFRQAGCEVRTIGPSTPHVYGKSTGGDHVFPEEDFVEPTYPVSNFPYDVNDLVGIARRAGFEPDLFVFVDQFDPYFVTGELHGAKYVNLAIENWNETQRARYERRKADAEYYCIAHSNEAPLPPEGEWVVFGADPSVHPHLNLKRDKLVCQIGSAYEPRPQIWNALRAHFDNAPAVGTMEYHDRLYETPSTLFGRAPSYREHAEAYNRSLCAISSSNVNFIPMRGVEAFAMGCVLLSDDVEDMRKAFGAPYRIYSELQHKVIRCETTSDTGIWIAHTRTAGSIAACIEHVRDMPHTDDPHKFDSAERDNLTARAIAFTYRQGTYAHTARRMLARVGIKGATRLV